MAQELASVRAKRQELKDSAAAFIKKLHEPNEAVPAALPAALSPYRLLDLPESSEVSRELAIHQALQSAKGLHTSGKTAEAIKSLNTLKPDAEVSALRGEMEAAAAGAISGK